MIWAQDGHLTQRPSGTRLSLFAGSIGFLTFLNHAITGGYRTRGAGPGIRDEGSRIGDEGSGLSYSSCLLFRHIAIEGPPGVGKTALAERLSARLDATVVRDERENPF